MRSSAIALVLLCGCNPVFTTVPISSATIGTPLTDLQPDSDTATILFTRSGGVLADTDQATTIVADQAAYVGQLRARSMFVVRVIPGMHFFTMGTPEAYGPDTCSGFSLEAKAGRVYVVATTTFGPLGGVAPAAPSPGLARELSYYTTLVPEVRVGAASVSTQTEWWNRCIETAHRSFDALPKTFDTQPKDIPSVEAFSIPSPP
jgi:hypothetical protein